MKFGRILANAVARRIAYVVVAAALAWLGFGEAKAQTYACQGNPSGCTRQQAYSTCLASIPEILVSPSYTGRCWTSASPAAITGTYLRQRSFNGGTWNTIAPGFNFSAGCPSGSDWNGYLNQCKTTCTGRPSSIASYGSMIPSGSVSCVDGCEAVVTPTGDGTYTRTFIGGVNSQCGVIPNNCSQNGTGYVMNAVTGMCQPPVVECKENEVKDPVTGVCEQGCPTGMYLDAGGLCKPKENDCPAGNVRAPSGECLPGEGQCAAGEARRANGTCGRDSNGDGVADEDDEDPENDPDKEFFAGGDSCSSPPSCSGGPIDCGMARIQWRIDCNTRRNVTISGGACNAMPLCVGDNCKAMEYAQLLQQWRTACALEKMAGAEGGEGAVGDANKNGVADVLEGRFTPSDGGGGDVETGVTVKTVGTSLLNSDNIFGAGSCPQFPPLVIMERSFSPSDLPHWCNALAILRGLILIFGAFTALKILMGWGF